MKVLSIIFIFPIFFLTSCSETETHDEARSMNQPDRPMSVLKDLVINKGDVDAYEELETAYLDYNHGDFYKYAKIMADKYDYSRAYYDVYIQILKPTQNPHQTISLDSCTSEEKQEAIYYLKKSFEKGFQPAGEELEQLKKDGFIE